MITSPSIWAAMKDLAENGYWELIGSGAPTSGTSGSGAGFAGLGSMYRDSATGYTYKNTGTAASPTWSLSALSSIAGAVLVSSATIVPTNLIHHVSGTVAIATITLPNANFQGPITLIPDAAFTTVTTGNISLASTGVINKSLIMVYDGTKWNPSY